MEIEEGAFFGMHTFVAWMLDCDSRIYSCSAPSVPSCPAALISLHSFTKNENVNRHEFTFLDGMDYKINTTTYDVVRYMMCIVTDLA